MANVIRRQNVATLRSLAATEGYAYEVNSQFLLHEVIRQAEDQGETLRLIEIFNLLGEIPGVDINLQRDLPPGAAGMRVVMGTYGTPLELALSKGLPQISLWLVEHLGYDINDVLPRVELTLFEWSILLNKQELFMKLLESGKVDLYFQQEYKTHNAFELAVKSYNSFFVTELLKQIDFHKMDFGSHFLQNPAVTAILANKPDLAQAILEHPTMSLDLLDALRKKASTLYWSASVRQEILRLLEAERQTRVEGAKAFGEVLYRKGAEPGLGPLVGSYMGLTKRRRRRDVRQRRRTTRGRL